ncbi:MAG: hypothetical protein JNJ63_02805 [Hyphomonadaceae bacterium]|nr:hypothetical protein [Hyphomonadaceae bacterium]
MRRIIAVLVSLSAFAPLTAHAEERMSDARFLSASRCLAYESVASLQADGVDYSALRSAVTVGMRDPVISDRARQFQRETRIAGNRARQSERALADLRANRDEACQPFVERGLVQLNTSTARS